MGKRVNECRAVNSHRKGSMAELESIYLLAEELEAMVDGLENEMSYRELHTVAQYLYELLDDIDSAGDIAKGDDKLYRAIVERTQSQKWAVVAKCDGYAVTLKPLRIT